jgi:hypothetical protein
LVRLAAGDGQFHPAQPLLALRRGDEIRVSGNGQVVLLYHAGSGTRRITRADSPFTVGSPPPVAADARLRDLLATVGEVLRKQDSTSKRTAAVRGAAASVKLVSPRSTRLLPGSLVFEWAGGDGARHAIRLTGPGGRVVWEARNVTSPPVTYPADAPRLVAGDQYTWEVETPGLLAEPAWFQILTEREARRVRELLGVLNGDTRDGYSRGTIPLMRAAVLVNEGLYADARRELSAAVAMNPVEPSYQMLLANVYERIGLTDWASAACERALALAGIASGTRTGSSSSPCRRYLAAEATPR